MAYLEEMDSRNGYLDSAKAKSKGSELAAQYSSAIPYPHIVIDNFLPPELLDICLTNFPTEVGSAEEQFDKPQERLKFSFNPDTLSSDVRGLFYAFNSRPFIRVIENITGIKGLIPDPFFYGGGFHELRQGGHLSIHADFNHHKPMNLERRVNVLIYLNKDWRPEYGGQLELWDNEMTNAVHSIVPLFNRCAIFNTTSNSNHGNPNPINHPHNISRRSIALYYYTSTWSADKLEHTTKFQVRPGSSDKVNWNNRFREFVLDCIPPIVSRRLLTEKTGSPR